MKFNVLRKVAWVFASKDHRYFEKVLGDRPWGSPWENSRVKEQEVQRYVPHALSLGRLGCLSPFCPLHDVPHFGTWDARNAGNWPSGSQARYVDCWVRFTNSLCRCTDLSFSPVLWWEILILGTQNSANCRKCNWIPQTFMEHTSVFRAGRENKAIVVKKKPAV